MQVQDGRPPGGPTPGQSLLGDPEQPVELLGRQEAVHDDAAALGRQAAGVAKRLDLALVGGRAERGERALLTEDLTLARHDGLVAVLVHGKVDNEDEAAQGHELGELFVREEGVVCGVLGFAYESVRKG